MTINREIKCSFPSCVQPRKKPSFSPYLSLYVHSTQAHWSCFHSWYTTCAFYASILSHCSVRYVHNYGIRLQGVWWLTSVNLWALPPQNATDRIKLVQNVNLRALSLFLCTFSRCSRVIFSIFLNKNKSYDVYASLPFIYNAIGYHHHHQHQHTTANLKWPSLRFFL